MYDLIVLGGSAQGLSAAITAQNVDASNVLIIEPGVEVAYPHLIGPEKLNVAYGETVSKIALIGDYLQITNEDGKTYDARSCVVALNAPDATFTLPSGVTPSNKVHEGPFDGAVKGKDILVVGSNDRAVVLASKYVRSGARSVVLAASGMNPDVLANASRDEIKSMENQRLLSVLYRSSPVNIETDQRDNIWVQFNKTNPPTPELVLDHVVFAANQKLVEPEKIGIGDSAIASGRVMYARDPRLSAELPSGTCNEIITSLSQFFSFVNKEKIESISIHKPDYASAPEDLARELYNAEVVEFDTRHSDLWVLKIRPDTKEVSFEPGQFTSVGVGYWEPKIHGEITDAEREKWDKRALRSYSISSPIFSPDGYLSSGVEDGCLEFYVVLVPPELDPVVTPRLALFKPGDRIYMGGKITGDYTLRDVKVKDNIVFFATGTGEAPHNAMIADLLRRGHQGKIISAVSVRNKKDLGYLDKHRKLEEMFPNYTYLPMPTREPSMPKRYCQDLIRDGDIEKIFGDLDPSHTQAFACGNPSMIGAPDKDGKLPVEQGIVGLLVDRGFAIADRKNSGQIHYDKYW